MLREIVRGIHRGVKITTMVAGVIFQLLRIVLMTLLSLLLLRTVAFNPLLVLVMVMVPLKGCILGVIECRRRADHGR